MATARATPRSTSSPSPRCSSGRSGSTWASRAPTMTPPTSKDLTMKPIRFGRLLTAFLLPLVACSTSDIVNVESPDIINPGAVNSPAGAAALYAGAIGEFSVAIVGDNGGLEGQILVTGSFGDELINSETFPTRLEYELRAIDVRNGTLTTVFRNLQ